MPQRQAGEYLRERRDALAIVTFAGLAVVLLLGALGFVHPLFSAAALPLLAYLWWQSKDGRWLDPDSWVKGLRGERAVGRALEALTDPYRVLHDLETGRGNVDHVVIGPTGIFAIETKEWNGRFSSRGGRLLHNGREERQVLRQATAGAAEVRRRLAAAGLNVWVEAVVVSSRALVQNGKLRLPRATVLDLAALVSHIERARQGLSPDQVARAAEAVEGRSPVPSA